MSSLFGWNLLYNSVVKDIKSNQDVLICLTHFVLISNGFECIGIGESQNMDGNEPKSEALPAGWNDNYRLRYVYQGRLYLLQGNELDDGIMINLIRTDERSTSMIQLNNRLVLRRTGTIDDMIPSNRDILKQIKEQLIEKVTKSVKSKEGSTQTTEKQDSLESRSSSGLRVMRPPRMYQDPLDVGLGRHDLDPLSGIGGPQFGGIPGLNPGGRNPFAGGGGGMLFQPPSAGRHNPPGMPPGAIPPGARFDPFRPPDVDLPPPTRPRRPDNDEMPPPGFDDMYM